jgi:hypothetical protein
MVHTSSQIVLDEGKTERKTNALVLLGKLILGALIAS